ncbi:MAG: hypothetical protein F4052_02540 [Dehalococcoidia bacterium]|nr:hypothetical protein [Dehalococcoidia bacterium]
MAENIRYEPEEKSPPLTTLVVAFQGTALVVSNTVMIASIFAAAFDDDGSYLEWALFASLLVAGAVVALQATRYGRLGSGYVLLMGPGVPFLAVCVLAVHEGGLALMSSLVVASSLIQFAVGAWLAQLRRLITPVVAGVAFMMIAVSAMPIAMERLNDVPAGASAGAGVAVAAVTLGVAALLMLRGRGLWRLWALPIAIVAGCAVAAPLGVYDAQRALDTPWFYLPSGSSWPGFASILSEDFWALLLVFLVVSLVVAVRASNEGAVIQQVSRRNPRTIDFRSVQGTLNASGIAIFLSGIAGTPPTIIYLPTTISLIDFTGVAARRAAVVMGAMVIVLALLPKIVAVLHTIPVPVTGALLLIIMGLFFVEGTRSVFREGLSRQRAFIVGVSLSIAVGLQSQNIVADVIGGPWGVALGNGVVLGVFVAVLLTVVLDVTGTRRKRLETELDGSAFPHVEAFLRELGAGAGWGEAATDRLCAAGEETVSAMLQLRDDYESDKPPRLVVLARPATETVELEFLAVFSEENIEDRLAYLSEQAEAPDVSDISFRLLRHYASSVRHRKYHGLDIVTVEVEGSRQ